MNFTESQKSHSVDTRVETEIYQELQAISVKEKARMSTVIRTLLMAGLQQYRKEKK
jgi:hypothetical protein